MNSIQISCFLEAAKQKSFSKAAAALFISQPTFSRNISSMEEELGLTLFRRNSFHGIRLTKAGEIMLEAFSGAKKEILSAHEKALHAEQKSRIRLEIGMLEGQLLDGPLEELITGFRLSFSNVRISIRRDNYAGLMNALLSDEIQFVYMPEWQFADNAQIVIQFIGFMETRLVIPKRLLPETDGTVHSLKEFSHFPFITVNDTESSASKNMLLDLFAKLQISPPVYEASSIREQIGLVEIGEGIVLINPNNSICYSPNVHCIQIKELKPQPFAICWKRSSDDEGVTLFSRFLHNHCSSRKPLP